MLDATEKARVKALFAEVDQECAALESEGYNGMGGHDHSRLQVLKSAAGYYVGHLYYDRDCECYFPFDRQSDGYFATREEAQAYCNLFIEE